MKIAALIVALLASLPGQDARADNFRCGKYLATPDLSVADLVARCGEPVARESRTEDVMTRSRRTGLMYVSGQVTTERWIYDRGVNASPMVVTIVEGRIKSIERQQ